MCLEKLQLKCTFYQRMKAHGASVHKLNWQVKCQHSALSVMRTVFCI